MQTGTESRTVRCMEKRGRVLIVGAGSEPSSRFTVVRTCSGDSTKAAEERGGEPSHQHLTVDLATETAWA